MKYLSLFLAMLALGCDTPNSPSNASLDSQSEGKAGALGQQGRSHLDEHNESETANEHPEQGSSIGDAQHPPSASHFDDSPTLSPRQILARASIDLRGQRPTREELAAIDARPESLHAMIDDFIAGPKLGNLLMDLAARWLRSRIEFYPIPNANEESDPNLSYSVAEEPLRLFKYIVDNDRSYAEFVMADYTLVDERLASIWPIEGYDLAQGGWQKVFYSDGRPAGGYLSTNAFYLRYLTDEVNHNRGRANAASRILLCDNYLVRPIDFPRNIDLTDEEGIKTAIRSNDGCVACHATLDPLASYFGPFSELEDTGRYDGDMLDAWTDTTQVGPAFNGRPGETVTDLVTEISADRRYARCITQRLYEALIDRPSGAEDQQVINQYTQAFITSGLKIRALIKSLVLDKVYRGASDGRRQGTARKALSPELLDRVIQDLTGSQLTNEGVPLMLSDDSGYHILGGGLSAEAGDYPSQTHNVTRILVQNRLAETASWYVVATQGQSRDRLLGDIDPSTDPMRRADIVHILSLVWSQDVPSNSQDVDELLGLFNELRTQNVPPTDAWAGVLSVIFRSPEFIMY